jgi:hypothetical protein
MAEALIKEILKYCKYIQDLSGRSRGGGKGPRVEQTLSLRKWVNPELERRLS